MSCECGAKSAEACDRRPADRESGCWQAKVERLRGAPVTVEEPSAPEAPTAIHRPTEGNGPPWETHTSRLAALPTEREEEPSAHAALGAVPDYPTEVLPEAARLLVELGQSHGLPPALVGGAALAALATALGSGPEIQVMQTWQERATLWIPLIAPAGAGKSPALRLAYSPLRAWDNSLDDDRPPLLLGDLTLEALVRRLNEEDGVALVIDELSQQLRGLGEYKRGGGGDRGRFLTLWLATAPLRSCRRRRQAEKSGEPARRAADRRNRRRPANPAARAARRRG